MKKLIKFFTIVFSIAILMHFSQNVYAEGVDSFSYDDYLKGISEGWIDKEISYDYLININKEAENFYLNDNFTKVCEAENFEDFSDFITYRANISHFNPGDVFVMNSNASGGLSGHSAMALSNIEFVSIHGKGTKPVIMNRDEFINNYKYRDITVYRPNNYDWGASAAIWADSTYRNPGDKFTYKISLDLTDIYKTYCSKMVYHSYLYGNKNSVITSQPYGLIHPYLLKNWVKIYHHAETQPENW